MIFVLCVLRPKPFTVVFDTGSGHLILPSSCPWQHTAKICQDHPANANQISTDLTCLWQVLPHRDLQGASKARCSWLLRWFVEAIAHAVLWVFRSLLHRYKRSASVTAKDIDWDGRLVRSPGRFSAAFCNETFSTYLHVIWSYLEANWNFLLRWKQVSPVIKSLPSGWRFECSSECLTLFFFFSASVIAYLFFPWRYPLALER